MSFVLIKEFIYRHSVKTIWLDKYVNSIKGTLKVKNLRKYFHSLIESEL